MSIFISIVAIYGFVIIGYLFKTFFKEKVNEETLVLLVVYCLQPLLVFWSLSIKKIDKELIMVPLIFLLLVVIIAIFSYFWGKIFFNDQKTKSILISSSTINNTGNLGIPLAIAFFGNDSIIYTGLIIIANIILIQTLGVYSYSRGEFSIKKSFLNILKLPAFGIGVLALIINLCGISLHESLLNTLQIGAYGLMCMQLILFGIFLAKVKIKDMSIKLLLHVNFIKYIITPIICLATIYYLDLSPLFAGVLLLLMLTPTAINNINLASLFNCHPNEVTAIVFVTSMVFIPILFLLVYLLQFLGNSALL